MSEPSPQQTADTLSHRAAHVVFDESLSAPLRDDCCVRVAGTPPFYTLWFEGIPFDLGEDPAAVLETVLQEIRHRRELRGKPVPLDADLRARLVAAHLPLLDGMLTSEGERIYARQAFSYSPTVYPFGVRAGDLRVRPKCGAVWMESVPDPRDLPTFHLLVDEAVRRGVTNVAPAGSDLTIAPEELHSLHRWVDPTDRALSIRWLVEALAAAAPEVTRG